MLTVLDRVYSGLKMCYEDEDEQAAVITECAVHSGKGSS